MRRNELGFGLLFCIAITTMISSQVNAQIVFDFNNESDFDNGQGIGATATAMAPDGTSATVSIVDLFAPEFVSNSPTATILRASQGATVVTQIDNNSLGIDNPSVLDDDFFPDAEGDGAGIENRDINDREGLVLEFDVPVVFTEIDFVSLDDGVVTVTIEGMGSFDIVNDDDVGPNDDFALPFGTDFIPAGADITITLSSPTATDANLRITEFTVTTSADFLSRPTFDFNNNTDFDGGQGVGATSMATSLDGTNAASISIVDLFAPAFVNNSPTSTILRASEGGLVTTQIGSNSLGVDNPSVLDNDFFPDDTGDGAGQENRDINDGEGLVFAFDVPVVITELALVSLDDGTVTVDIEGVGSFDFVADDGNPSDDFSLPFGTDFIPAGAEVTVSLSSPATPDASVRIQEITVSTVAVDAPFMLGDVSRNGTVDFDDIGPFIAVLASTGFQFEADIDGNNLVNFDDIGPFIGVLSSQ